MNDFIFSAKRTIDMECAAVHALHERIDDKFSHACQILLSCKGKVVVTGMGKSGHIANKIAATLASTGTSAQAASCRISDYTLVVRRCLFRFVIFL